MEEIRALVEIITEEIKEFEKFLGFLAHQAKVLTAGDFDSFDRCVSLQEGVSLRLDLLEARRKEITASLAEKLNLKSRDLNLAHISQLVETSESTKLRELHQTLLGLCRKVERARATNELVIRESARLIGNEVSAPGGDIPADQNGDSSARPVYEVAGMMN